MTKRIGLACVLDESKPDGAVNSVNIGSPVSDEMIRKECNEYLCRGQTGRKRKAEAVGADGGVTPDMVRKRFKEGVSEEVRPKPPVPPALEPSGRGLKRKIGCIIVTQTGKLENDYVKRAEIGRGTYGSVSLCESKKEKGVEFACKTVRKGAVPVHKEVEIMQHLSGHPGVVTLEDVYEEDDCFHLVMELCSGGRLLDQMAKLGRYPEPHAAIVLKEVMLAVKYCHELGVVHRDIKPDNLLLTSSGKIKLADFGLSLRIRKGQTLSGNFGTLLYMAPELVSGTTYDEKIDIWSCGVLLHALLVGFLPFSGDKMEVIFEDIKTQKLDFNGGIWEYISTPARDLLARMLNRDVSARMTADEVLRHPWIKFYTDRPKLFKFRNRRNPSPSSKARRYRQTRYITRELSVLEKFEQELAGRFCGKDLLILRGVW